jgi:hypothetical protein
VGATPYGVARVMAWCASRITGVYCIASRGCVYFVVMLWWYISSVCSLYRLRVSQRRRRMFCYVVLEDPKWIVASTLTLPGLGFRF